MESSKVLHFLGFYIKFLQWILMELTTKLNILIIFQKIIVKKTQNSTQIGAEISPDPLFLTVFFNFKWLQKISRGSNGHEMGIKNIQNA